MPVVVAGGLCLLAAAAALSLLKPEEKSARV
jgi:NaMN:DMB phosphoribosyltransferase